MKVDSDLVQKKLDLFDKLKSVAQSYFNIGCEDFPTLLPEYVVDIEKYKLNVFSGYVDFSEPKYNYYLGVIGNLKKGLPKLEEKHERFHFLVELARIISIFKVESSSNDEDEREISSSDEESDAELLLKYEENE